jgi:hypothetical protein
MSRCASFVPALVLPGLAACCVLLVTGVVPPLRAEEARAPSADEVVARYLEAIGGVEALKNVETRKVRYRVHMFGRDGYSMERSWSRPDVMRTGMPGAPVYTLTEGGKSWRIGPEGRSKLPAPVAANFARLADIDGPLVDPAKKGVTLEHVGTEQYDMTELEQIRLTFKDGTRWELFFDARSGLLRKRKQPSFYILNGEVTRGPDTWTYFYDYRPVQNLLLPHLRVQATESHTHVFVTEEIVINE